jgi:hypothetical protein
MKIQDMPAGREMDALVAERVMGWTKSDVELFINRFHPSSEICCAWEVVEKIGLPVAVIQSALGDDDFSCEFMMNADGDTVCGNADTPMLAICRAALMAVGGDR